MDGLVRDNASFTASPAVPIAAPLAAIAGLSQPVESALYLWGFNIRGQTSHRAGLRGDPRTWRCQRAPLRIAREKFRARDGQPVALVSVACGLEHSAAVGIDGSLFTWGSNEYGQLGDGTEQSSKEPIRVAALEEAGEEVTAVACGAQCTAAITRRRADGRGRGKRRGGSAEHGGGGEEEGEEGRLWVWGQNQNSNLPRLIRGAFPPKTVVIQVSCGDSHAAAVSNTGLLQTWGYNEHGQLGIGRACDGLQKPHLVASFQRFLDDPPLTCPDSIRIVAVACGGFHTAAVDARGEMYTWGGGLMGQLGHRTLQARGGTCEVVPRRVVALEGVSVTQVACGRTHTCALTHRGALYIWGAGRDGQLGTGPTSASSAPTSSSSSLPSSSSSCPSFHHLHTGFTSNTTASSNSRFGGPFGGGFGAGASGGGCSSLDFVRGLVQRQPLLLMPKGVRLVTCGQDHTLVAMADDQILGWGYNSCGQAATGRESYAWLPMHVDWCVGKVQALAAGGGHSAVLTVADSLKLLTEFRLAHSLDFSLRRPGGFSECAKKFYGLPGEEGSGEEEDGEVMLRRQLALAERIVEESHRLGADSLVRYSLQFWLRVTSDVDPDMDEKEQPAARGRRQQSIMV